MGVSFICLLPSTLGPALPMRARQRSSRPGQLFGLCVGERGATTLAIQRSLSGARTTGQSVCRALTADFTATRNIQGARRGAEAALHPGPVGFLWTGDSPLISLTACDSGKLH